jgi:lycopene beta-cyclase
LGRNYDYIITGMGCAGLSLAMQMISCGLSSGKKILLVDREQKKQNDRTWCFWETSPGAFEDIVFRRWDHAWFHSADYSSLLDLKPYAYKMIRGIDFFQYCLAEISANPSFDIIYGSVESLSNTVDGAIVSVNGEAFQSRYLFNSIIFDKPTISKGEYYLLQHFKGWVIRTPDAFFTLNEPTLMDFRPDQRNGTTFVYLMPFSSTEALIEYTLFTESLLHNESYDAALASYIHDILGLSDYEIMEKEFGIIPMTNYRFKRREGNILNIGTAGGRTKASSGYTFRFIQKDTEEIIGSLKYSGNPFGMKKDISRFNWYDSVLLNILAHNKLRGADIFTHLFKKNNPQKILKFLDNDSSVSEELRILSTLPQWPFAKAGIEEGFKKLKRSF